MYYLFQLSDNWSILEVKTGKSRPLREPEIELLRMLFPALLAESGSLFLALEVNLIPPNKLMKLSVPNPMSPSRKLPDKQP